jgi:hypothetical protein
MEACILFIKNSAEVKAKAGDFLFAVSDPNVLWFNQRLDM